MGVIKIRLVLFTCICLMSQRLSAQEAPCGTVPFSKEKVKEIERIATSLSGLSTAGITYLPVKLHLTRYSSGGTAYYPIKQAVYEFAKLNEKFLPLGFQFYLCDTVNYIDDYRLDEFTSPYYSTDSLALVTYNVNNAINVYYVNESNVGGRSNFPSGDKFYNWMFVKNGNFDLGETLIHEMGHYFNLYHTFETYLGAELVNGSNCSTAGDLVCDTPADAYPITYDRISCQYTGTHKDANNQLYMPSTTNYMSYYGGGCIFEFTEGQRDRAQAGHAARLSMMNSAGNQYNFSYPSNDTIFVSNVRAFELFGSVNLKWETNAYPLGFIIERSTSPNSGFVTIGSNNGVYSLQFVDKDVQAGVTYYYRVKSVTSAANYSMVASITPSVNSYPYGSSYNPSVHDVRYFQFYNSLGYVSLAAYFPNYLDPYFDYSDKIGSVIANEKYRVYWLDYYNYSSNRDSFKVWVDLNKNRMFESSEMLASGNGSYSSDSLIIPANTPTGYYRMRFRTNNSSYPFSDSDRQLFSDTKDITLYINGTCEGSSLPVIGYQFLDTISDEGIETIDFTGTYPEPYSGYPVRFSASSVTLNPGFIADGYNTFQADTDGCE